MPEQQLSFINEEANPPILIVSKLTRSPKRYSSNTYVDPIDDRLFEVEDLTSLEKGHIYNYLQTSASTIEVNLPVRVMDKELSSLLSKHRCFSFRSIKDTVRVHRDSRESSKKMNSCIQDFTLSIQDFEKFKDSGTKLGYLFKDSSVNEEDLISKFKDLQEFCLSKIHQLVSNCRANTANKSMNLENAIAGLKEVERNIVYFRIQHKDLLKSKDTLSRECGREDVKATVNFAYAQAKTMFDLTTNLDLSRVYSECVHNMSDAANAPKPSYLSTLEWELGRLSQFFPTLRHLRVDGETAILNLSGVKIILNPDSIRIEGDISALQPYTSGVEVRSKESRSRFSGILFQEEN